jgi:hypothetical protein
MMPTAVTPSLQLIADCCRPQKTIKRDRTVNKNTRVPQSKPRRQQSAPEVESAVDTPWSMHGQQDRCANLPGQQGGSDTCFQQRPRQQCQHYAPLVSATNEPQQGRSTTFGMRRRKRATTGRQRASSKRGASVVHHTRREPVTAGGGRHETNLASTPRNSRGVERCCGTLQPAHCMAAFFKKSRLALVS